MKYITLIFTIFIMGCPSPKKPPVPLTPTVTEVPTVIPTDIPTPEPTLTPTIKVTDTPTPEATVTATPTDTPTYTVTPVIFNFPVEIHRVSAGSVYDNYTIKVANKYVQFRCQNTPDPVYRDRIWLSESPDGISNWTNDRIIIQGTNENDQDDLSCSPGAVIAPNGMWHLYYVTAPRVQMCRIEMWHATSIDGLIWTKLGRITAVPVSDCSLIQPSPIIENGKIRVYFPVNWGHETWATIWAMDSDDGHIFTRPVELAYTKAFGGRITKEGNRYYYAYSFTLDGTNKIPDAVGLAVTTKVYNPVVAGPGGGGNGLTYPVPLFDTPGHEVARAKAGTFYNTQLFSGNYYEGRMNVSGNYMPLCTPPAPSPCSDYPNAIGVLLNVK